MNTNQTKDALIAFSQKYQDNWFSQFHHAAKSEDLYGISSPCIIDSKELAVFWQPILTDKHNLNIVEEVMNLQIHADAHIFYGSQYAGDMQAQFADISLSLIQVWSEEDFSRLEQNLIAHLTMQKKLKRRPSIFLASTTDDAQIIALDNQTGAIILEKLIENETIILADSLYVFLQSLIPIAQ